MTNVGLDLDGCIADFNTSAIKLGNRLFGTSAPLDDPPQWDYFKLWWTKEQETILWMSMEEEFWLELTGLLTPPEWEKLREIVKLCPTYFITSRPMGQSKKWAEAWLIAHGIACPTVVVTQEKGMAASVLDLDIMWDDYPWFLGDVRHYRGWRTRCYLQDHCYNHDDHGEWTRVRGLMEVIEKEQLG